MSSLSSGRSSVNSKPCAAAGTLVEPCRASPLVFTTVTSWYVLRYVLGYVLGYAWCRCNYMGRITRLQRRYGRAGADVNHHWTVRLRRVAAGQDTFKVQLRVRFRRDDQSSVPVSPGLLSKSSAETWSRNSL